MVIHVVFLERHRHGYDNGKVCPDAKQPVGKRTGVAKDYIVRDVVDPNEEAVIDEACKAICCHSGPEIGEISDLSDIVSGSDIDHYQQ